MVYLYVIIVRINLLQTEMLQVDHWLLLCQFCSNPGAQPLVKCILCYNLFTRVCHQQGTTASPKVAKLQAFQIIAQQTIQGLQVCTAVSLPCVTPHDPLPPCLTMPPRAN